MTVGLRRGHNFKTRGAKHYIDEVVEADKIKNEIINIFKENNFKYVDCTPGDCGVKEDLQFGTNKANNNNVNFYFSIHFNASKVTDKAVGTEVWTYSKKLNEAQRVINNLVGLGFKDRGIKHSTKYWDLRKSKCEAMIIEICFVDSKMDSDLYFSLGYKKVAEAIAYAIMDKPIPNKNDNNTSKPSDDNKTIYRVVSGSYSNLENAEKQVNKLKSLGIDSFIMKGEK